MYASVAEMTKRYGELEMISISDRQRTGSVDTAVVDVALSDAIAEINGYLTRYTLPFTVTPPELVRVCCDIAHYRLCGINNTLLSDEIIKRYEQNVKWLEKVSKGTVSLSGVVDANDGKDDASDAVQFMTGNRIFGR
ncbi:MAG: DUF1320 family protein [Gammaproteobacteria bacterium]|nr:DUF1320 family protein [Gammaproteobacteria bacterium]